MPLKLKAIKNSFKIERNKTAVTIFLSIVNWMKFRSVHNWNENCHCNYLSSFEGNEIRIRIRFVFKSTENLPTLSRPDAIWCDFVPIIFFSSFRIFYVKMATSEGGWGGRGLHILNCNRACFRVLGKHLCKHLGST